MQDDVKELCEWLTHEVVIQRDAHGYTSQVRNPDGKEAAATIARLSAENERYAAALIRLRDCEWIIGWGDRMYPVRAIAREALG